MLKILNEYEQAYEKIKDFVQDEDNAEVWSKSYLLSLDEDLEVLRKLVIETTNPTLEEVKKEWENLGYEWSENPDCSLIILKNEKKDTKIKINKFLKTYYVREYYCCDYQDIKFQEHQLLTKTFKALGWEK